ncbi:uncharacterized protein LOC130725012 [Lotus japonicus]|uniref:uncharacterized protein LOC130725012 n=1 Tax=Lotus japonicus TaxID=34305 RepID=UPI0025863B95|nr:uncharacterized protein LOC130725012 [Lotus japonicus]
MILLSYNVRDLGSSVKLRALRELVRQEKIDMMLIQESKLEVVDQNLCRSIWGADDCEWVFKASNSRARGLICIWQVEKFVLVDSLIGDFNAVTKPEERIGSANRNLYERREINDFNSFISNLHLLEPPLAGKKFTWFSANGQAASRQDRFLLSHDWCCCWPNSNQLVLNRTLSDHCPVLFRVSNLNWGPKPFKVLNCWFSDPRFKDFVAKEWEQISISGASGFVLKEKLKAIKEKLKIWNKDIFGDVNQNYRELVEKLEELDQKLGNGGLSTQEQKQWKRQSNCLVGLHINELWVEDPVLVKNGAREFFDLKFRCDNQIAPTLDGIPFRRIGENERMNLMRSLILWRLKKQFGSVELIKAQVRMDCPANLSDYRPISLVGCAYKIVSKVLANRIKKVLPSVINEAQSAFLEGRGLMDSVVVANEWAHDAKSRKKGSMAFKVDFEKAYDSVRWDFLYYMMHRMNFGDQWISWIKGCIEPTRVSVLINGSPSGEFSMGKGIRQGDPITPFLFFIIAEGLNGLMRQAVDLHQFKGYCFGRQTNEEVSILQFADDTLFIGEATKENAFTLKCMLHCFELASGLKVNFFKSSLIGITVEERDLQILAAILNFKLMKLPFIYLGLQV